jgi:hypothetical protein
MVWASRSVSLPGRASWTSSPGSRKRAWFDPEARASSEIQGLTALGLSRIGLSRRGSAPLGEISGLKQAGVDRKSCP